MIAFEVGANGYSKVTKVSRTNRTNFYVVIALSPRTTDFNVLFF